MKRVMVLSLSLLLGIPGYFLSSTFVVCCEDHSDMVKVYLDSLKSLVVKVKAEPEEQFFRMSHKKEGLTYLNFLVQTSREGIQHYEEMISKLDKVVTNMEDFKLSQKAVESLQKKAQQYAARVKTAKDDKEAKAIIEKIDLDLQL